MNVIRNENGVALVVAICILAILTIIATASLNISITEQRIATNDYIHHKNFYTSESGQIVGVLMAMDETFYPESEYDNINWVGNGSEKFGTKLLNTYTYEVTPQTAVDPSDGIEKVLKFGDEDGDYMNETNFNVGTPSILVLSGGTHVRGGIVKIEGRYRFQPMFVLPNSALRVHSNVNGNGVSGSILGEHPSGSSCDDVADIMYDVAGGIIEYGGDLGDTPVIEESTGMFPLSLIGPVLKRKSQTEMVPGSNNLDEGYLNGLTSVDNPGILYVDGPGITSKTNNLSGHGILFVDGNFDFAGNLDWTGIIMVKGDVTFSGGGTKVITGAVVVGGEAVALNGSVDIQYDCEVLNGLNEKFGSYVRQSWRQL